MSLHGKQLHLAILDQHAPADGSLPRTMAAVAPALAPSAFLATTSSGLRVSLPLPDSVVLPEQALDLYSHVYERMSGQAAAMRASTVEAALVSPSEDAFVDLGRISTLDAMVSTHFAAWAFQWSYAAQAPLVQLPEALSPALVLSRYCHVASLLLGSLAWVGSLPAADELVARADLIPAPGDWRLVTSAAAEAALSFGPAAVFSSGELVEVNLMSSALLAVATAAADLLASTLSTPLAAIPTTYATFGPNVDLVGILSRS